MQQLVIGLGQIGTAVREVVGCDGHDPEKGKSSVGKYYQILHICFPYSKMFKAEVARYIELFEPKLVIVHSTVPVGTCKELGVVHSPVRGIHPNLKEGILTFVKFFGGKNAEMASEIFKAKGVKARVVESSNDTEALKLWDTTQYGMNIAMEKLMHDYCIKNNISFDLVYTEANQTYNDGYKELGHPEYSKYLLKHHVGKIGGHCVIPNLEFLKSPVADFIKEVDMTLEKAI